VAVTCSGDSGGPQFLGAGADETNTALSTTITGDLFCFATNVDYPLDTPSARAFLDDFVTLPSRIRASGPGAALTDRSGELGRCRDRFRRRGRLAAGTIWSERRDRWKR
jgi:hypothetical protein